MKVTVLIENTAQDNLVCEHGLSLLIEHAGRKILLDAGSSEAFYENAEMLGVTFDDLDACVLSHGHYDHSGGFEAVFGDNRDVKVYAQKSAIEPYFSGNGEMHEIGIPANVLAHADRFELVEGAVELFGGVWLVPHSSPELEKIGEKTRLYRVSEGEIVPDDFRHEQSLVFDTDKGLVIFNSCSHGGVENILREVARECGDKPVYAYVGGLHMKGKRDGEEVCAFSDKEVDALCETIKRAAIKYIYTGHCMGAPAFEKLWERLGNVVCELRTGALLNFSC